MGPLFRGRENCSRAGAPPDLRGLRFPEGVVGIEARVRRRSELLLRGIADPLPRLAGLRYLLFLRPIMVSDMFRAIRQQFAVNDDRATNHGGGMPWYRRVSGYWYLSTVVLLRHSSTCYKQPRDREIQGRWTSPKSVTHPEAK